MEQKKLKLILVVLAVFFFFVAVESIARAAHKDTTRLEATAGKEAKPHHHITGAWLDTFHNPTPWLEMGLDLRWRYIYGWNIDTLKGNAAGRDSKWSFTRNRFRWSTKSRLSDDVAFNTRLVWEFRTWEAPRRKPQDVDFDELLFDRFKLTMRNFLDMPLTAVVGRQDIILGKAWLVLDGTPYDGSRTIFLDAARLTYNWDEKNTKIDMIYIDQAAASDRWLQPINDRDKALTEQDEHGAILYVTNNSLENTQLEGYFIYKNDNPVDVTLDFPISWSKKAEIYTYGGAVSGDLDANWKYRVEGALQRGDKWDSSNTEQDLQAYGAKANLSYHFNDEANSNLHMVYEYLSGDDPSTDKIEQFDPLWGEWPQWSELYVYTYSRETMIGETTNLHRLGFGHSFKPCPKWTVNTDYNLLWAEQNNKSDAFTNGGFNFSGSGKFRGQLLTCWLKYRCCAQLSGHLLAEYFIPGSYYQGNTRDPAMFLRANIEYTF